MFESNMTNNWSKYDSNEEKISHFLVLKYLYINIYTLKLQCNLCIHSTQKRE